MIGTSVRLPVEVAVLALIDLDTARARRRPPVITLGRRHYRIRRPVLAKLVWWWQRRMDRPSA